jgi:argininosuccinate synthase
LKVVLAYSGGLDTSVCLKWLEEKYSAKVVTLTVDVGQKEDLKRVEERAIKIGAVKHYSIDAKEEFVKYYIFPAIKANALYQGKYPLGTALARPLIASKLVEVAEKENANAVAHGSTGKGNDQVRFEVSVRALNPRLRVIAPVREWGMVRDKEVEYAKEHGIEVSSVSKKYSIDENLWGRSIEGGPLENPENEPEDDVFKWANKIDNTPDEPEYVTITFDKGVPTRLNGEELNEVELIKRLNEIAGKHGVGVIDHIEDRLVGIKSREVYEYPAALTLIEAHKDLEKLTLTRHESMFKSFVEQEWSWLVYSGLWFEPLRLDLQAFIDETQKRVCGEVKVKLYKGLCRVVSRKSRYSLYNYGLATYESASTFEQRLGEGFAKLWGLPSELGYSKVKSLEAEKE